VTDRLTCVRPQGTSPLTGYRNYGCRCYTCSTACSDYERGKNAAIKAGQWRPFVDAAPVIEHLERLRAERIGYERIAKAAGLRPGLVIRYTNQYRARPKRIRPESAAAILAVTAFDALSAGRLVPAVGPRRRAEALAAIGWPLMRQADRLGYPRSQYRSTLNRPRVHVTFAQAVQALFDELSGTPGPSTAARRHALRMGWAPPLAWDDDIDLPGAVPHGVSPSRHEGRAAA
jgi:hypothetical protein